MKPVESLVPGEVVVVKLPVGGEAPATVHGVYAEGADVLLAVRAANLVLYSVKLPASASVPVVGLAEVVTYGVPSLAADLALAA